MASLSSVLLMCVSDAKTRKGSLRREHPLSSPRHLDQRTSAHQPGSVNHSKSFQRSSSTVPCALLEICDGLMPEPT